LARQLNLKFIFLNICPSIHKSTAFPLKSLLSALFLLGFIGESQAQRHTADWSAGGVTLNSGVWQTGFVRYNADLGLLELKANGLVQTLPAQKVASFAFFDAADGKHRTFVTRLFGYRRGLALPTFFELVVDGRVQLLAREQVQRSTLLRRLVGRGSNDYFLAYPEGDLIPYRGRLDQLYYLLDDHRPEVEFFVSRVNWYKHEEKPIAELVRFYNSLSTSAGGGQ